MKAFFRQYASTVENVEVTINILNKLSPEDRDLFSGVFFDTLQNYHEIICTDQRLNCCEAFNVRTLPSQNRQSVILDAPQPEFRIPE